MGQSLFLLILVVFSIVSYCKKLIDFILYLYKHQTTTKAKMSSTTATRMTPAQLKGNDTFHLGMIKMKVEMYIWKDNGNFYDCSDGRSIKPATMKGFVELVGISSKDFARIFISMPDKVDFLLKTSGCRASGSSKNFNKEKVLESVWSCSRHH